MSDDWEDWEDEAVEENLAAKVQEAKLKVETAVAPAKPLEDKPDMSKFADEKDVATEVVKHVVPESQPKKKDEKKAYLEKDKAAIDESLSDPAAERERIKKLQVEADLRDSVFGDLCVTEEKANVLRMPMETLKDSGTIATEVARLFITTRIKEKHYLAFVKNLVKVMCDEMIAGDVEDVERSLSHIRAEKARKEKEARDALKKPKKDSINQNGLGRARGAREDDYYAEAAEYDEAEGDVNDEYDDFM